MADEPTSAVDMIKQQEILKRFRKISDNCGTAILFISHDLMSVAQICDPVAILFEWQIVEMGDTEDLFERPQHAYAAFDWGITAAGGAAGFRRQGRRRRFRRIRVTVFRR